MAVFQVELAERWIEEIERIVAPSGMSVEGFIVLATKRCVAAIVDDEGVPKARAAGADWDAFHKVFGPGGEPPQDWDRID